MVQMYEGSEAENQLHCALTT